MLHELLTSNREEVIRRCSAKTAKRIAPARILSAIDHGVPIFLQQLVDTLQRESATNSRPSADSTPSGSAIGRTAALHGAELLGQGYSVDQVVRDYGDICQAATDLAVELKMEITADEFRTLNRCLDDAIADAVTAYGIVRQASAGHDAKALHEQLGTYVDEQTRLLDIAIHSYAAIRTGNIGVAGATGALLVHTLDELRALAGRALAAFDQPTRN